MGQRRRPERWDAPGDMEVEGLREAGGGGWVGAVADARSSGRLDATAGAQGLLAGMEWERGLPQGLPEAAAPPAVLVVDTNVWLGQLRVVESLRAMVHAGVVNALVVVPWVVMCELDGLKAPGGGSEEVRGLAREAGRYLHELFKSKDRFAQGQSLVRHQEAAKRFGPGSNDDRILHCALQLQLEEGCKVMLLTNDTNLGSKALVSDVPTERCTAALLDAGEARALQGRVEEAYRGWSGGGAGPGPSPAAAAGAAARPGARVEVSMGAEEAAQRMAAAFGALLEATTPYVVDRFFECFGEDWEEFCSRPPPWSLEQVFALFRKHWPGVFMDAGLGRGVREHIEDLARVHRRLTVDEARMHGRDAVRTIEASVAVLEAMNKASSGLGAVASGLGKLRGLQADLLAAGGGGGGGSPGTGMDIG